MKHPKGMKRGIRPMKRACGAWGKTAAASHRPTKEMPLRDPYGDAATSRILHSSFFILHFSS